MLKKKKKKLFIKNLIKNKLDMSFIKIFKIKKIINLFELLNIKIFLKFYVLFFKKVLFNILIITI